METNKLRSLTLNVFAKHKTKKPSKEKQPSDPVKPITPVFSKKRNNNNNNNQPKNILQVIKVQNAVRKFTPQEFAFFLATPDGNRQMFPTVFP